LMNEPGKVISESYKTISRPERPGLILAFAPFLVQNCGDEYVNVIAGLSGGVPCFGTIAVDDTLTFENCFMIANGEYYHDQMALVLIYGDIKPKFFIANISESRILEKKALVTKSEGHVLIEVNERPFIDYLDDLGLVKTSEIQYAMSSLPFLLDYNDGTPKVSKIFIMLTPDKHALCAGAMPEGSTLYMAMTDKDDVVLTTGEAVGKIAEDISGASLLLAYSCISRSMTMGSDIYREMEILKEKISGSLPFMMASSGGEICPTQILNGKATNRFHNNAFIACVL
ncbi:MAG: FIST C-terminal domain-containing protein, partial [Lachnospiraceae bacterium]|nr:FIST C-terminal domain-containing protein [Lachnospiraceae bacterium]